MSSVILANRRLRQSAINDNYHHYSNVAKSFLQEDKMLIHLNYQVDIEVLPNQDANLVLLDNMDKIWKTISLSSIFEIVVKTNRKIQTKNPSVNYLVSATHKYNEVLSVDYFYEEERVVISINILEMTKIGYEATYKEIFDH